MLGIFLQWLITFIVTMIVEIVVAWPILGLVEKRPGRRLMLILGVNLLTHPLVFVLATIATSITSAPAAAFGVVIVLEVGASIVEAVIYARAIRRVSHTSTSTPVAIAASFLANAASLFVCLVFWR